VGYIAVLHTDVGGGKLPRDTGSVVPSLSTLISAGFGTKLINSHNAYFCMATDGESSGQPPEDEMLPDERAVIADRLDELDDEERLSVADVADDLDIELDDE
jgi:hypothetical protein